MAGVDWDGVAEDYRPVLARIGSPLDFADLLWEVVGELGTSHAYIRPAGHARRGRQWRRSGCSARTWPGTPDGTWRMARVLPGRVLRPAGRCPRWPPRVPRSQPGDILLAVDGRPVDPPTGPGPLLVGSARASRWS